MSARVNAMNHTSLPVFEDIGHARPGRDEKPILFNVIPGFSLGTMGIGLNIDKRAPSQPAALTDLGTPEIEEHKAALQKIADPHTTGAGVRQITKVSTKPVVCPRATVTLLAQ